MTSVTRLCCRRVKRLLKFLHALPDLSGLVNGECASLLGESEKLNEHIESDDLVLNSNVRELYLGFGLLIGGSGGSVLGRRGGGNGGGWRGGKISVLAGRHGIQSIVVVFLSDGCLSYFYEKSFWTNRRTNVR